MTTDNVRTLARVVTIDDITPARNADRLELATIGGWQTVVGKGTYQPGDTVIYLEIDSLINVEDPRFASQLPDWLIVQAKAREGVDGLRYRIKTARLRGNISQGMLLNMDALGEYHENYTPGTDVTEVLDIIKYEPPLPVGGDMIGDYPHQFAVKSDSERIQNLTEVYDEIKNHKWTATEKIDGTSITVIVDENSTIRLAGRNWELDPENHAIWTVIDKQKILDSVPTGHAVQGEFFGSKIQGNPLKFSGKGFAVFNEFADGRALPRDQWSDWTRDKAVPTLNIELPDTPAELIAMVDNMESTLSPGHRAEGVVFHEMNGHIIPELGRPNFKVISNTYLLKHDG